MDDPGEENRNLWDAWSDGFQALWNADTADGELPPVPFPLDEGGSAEGWRSELSPDIEWATFAELGCGGGQATVGAARAGVETAVGVDFSGEQLRHTTALRGLYDVDAWFVAGDVTDLPFATTRSTSRSPGGCTRWSRTSTVRSRRRDACFGRAACRVRPPPPVLRVVRPGYSRTRTELSRLRAQTAPHR